MDDIKEVYGEAKAHGFAVPILRAVIRLRKIDKADLAEQETLTDMYKRALGMDTGDLPVPPIRPAEVSPRVQMMARMADESGVSPEVKDLAVRTAALSETNPHAANAVIATVKALAAEGRSAIQRAADASGGIAFPPNADE